MRTIAPAAKVLLGGRYDLAVLCELQFDTPTYFCTCRDSLEWAGHTYIGGKQTAIDAIVDQAGEVTGLKFGLSGVASDMIAIALAEPIANKLARASLAIMEPTGQRIEEVIELWAGTLDQMPISESGTSATIAVTAEHRGILFARPKGIMYSDAEQQRLYPGDKCLEFLASQAQHQDVWPAASFFRQ